jgi:hypothetical protein
MDIDEARSRLTVGIDAIDGVVAGVADDEAAYRPGPGAQCVLDVLGRLAAEEAEGFRARLRGALQGARSPDVARGREPLGGGRPGSVREALVRFREERAVSLAWLATLEGLDLQRGVGAPGASPCAGDLLASWVAHDLERIDELVRLRLAWWAERAAPYRIGAVRDAVAA